MADYADTNSEDRGRRPKDNQEDHEREFSPKESVPIRGGYKGPNRGSNQGWHGQDRRGYGRGQEQYDQSRQYHQRGWGHHPQHGRGRNFQQGGWGQNNQQEWQDDRYYSKGGQGHREQYHHKGRNNDHYQRENGEGRQEGYGGGGYGGRRRDEDPVVFLSKKLSFILRHGAEKMGFKMMPGGFLWVDEILRRNEYRDFTEEDIKHIVKTNDKQRFSLVADDNGRLKIRANQGHSVEVDGLELTPITDPSEAPEVIHGTYLKSWDIIKKQGLNKMGRNHIHFAAGEPGENGVISGMRSSCEVIIKLNMEKAIKGGLKFFRSANNVILSPGDADGFIRPCYFDSAFQRYPRGKLPFDSEIKEGPNIPGLSGELVKGKKKKNKKKSKEEREGETVKKEKNETLEQEVNMEGATYMFSEESTQGADQETEKTAPQTPENIPDSWDESVKSNNATNPTPNKLLEERLPSDGGTQDRPSIPGLSGDMAREDKKNKRKNKGNKNSEAADEAAMKETKLAASQTQENNVPDDLDESDKSNNATKSTPDKLLEFTSVDDVECCMSAVEELRSTGPVVVYCHLKGEEVTFVVCVSKTSAYNFKTELLAKEDLREFLNDASTEAKIFNSIADTSQMLFDKYNIMLDGTNVYNNKVAYDYVKERNLGNFNELPQGFDPQDWGSLAVGPELLKKCQVSLEAYDSLSSWTKSDKDFKISLFDEVNKNIGDDKLKAERQKRKQSKKKTASVSTSCTESKQGKKKKKGRK